MNAAAKVAHFRFLYLGRLLILIYLLRYPWPC